MTAVARSLGVIRPRQTAAYVEPLETRLRLSLDFAAQVEQPLQADLVGSELRYLRADVHVEPQELDVWERRRDLRHRQSLIERDSEFHPLFSGARVGMRSIDKHLRIHSERHRRFHLETLRDGVEDV